jgi:hypothetical protein
MVGHTKNIKLDKKFFEGIDGHYHYNSPDAGLRIYASAIPVVFGVIQETKV